VDSGITETEGIMSESSETLEIAVVLWFNLLRISETLKFLASSKSRLIPSSSALAYMAYLPIEMLCSKAFCLSSSVDGIISNITPASSAATLRVSNISWMLLSSSETVC